MLEKGTCTHSDKPYRAKSIESWRCTYAPWPPTSFPASYTTPVPGLIFLLLCRKHRFVTLLQPYRALFQASDVCVGKCRKLVLRMPLSPTSFCNLLDQTNPRFQPSFRRKYHSILIFNLPLYMTMKRLYFRPLTYFSVSESVGKTAVRTCRDHQRVFEPFKL